MGCFPSSSIFTKQELEGLTEVKLDGTDLSIINDNLKMKHKIKRLLVFSEGSLSALSNDIGGLHCLQQL